MKESATYQAILEEGAVGEARRVVRLLGDEAFGPPDAQTALLIEGLTDRARLEELLKRMRTATTWQDLLAPPATSQRRGRRRSSP